MSNATPHPTSDAHANDLDPRGWIARLLHAIDEHPLGMQLPFEVCDAERCEVERARALARAAEWTL